MPPVGAGTGKREVLAALDRLHREVGRQVAALERRHAERLVCRRGCCRCCVDGITVFEIEAERIRRQHRRLLAEARPHPEGSCAFLDEAGDCRIYEQRPYVCRTQGLPLRWLDDEDPEEPVELRDICPLNRREAQPVESLPARECWTLGPYESRLVRLQVQFGGSPPRRLPLRDLFDASRRS